MDVVVVAYASRAALARSLPAAFALRETGRVVVVDNGQDGSGPFASGLGADVVSLPSNPGFGVANNAGVARCQGDMLLLLNPDAEPDPQGITAGLAYLARHPMVAAVQGVIVNRATGEPERSQGRELAPVHLFGRALGLSRLHSVPLAVSIARRHRGLVDHVERVPGSAVPVESLAAAALLIRRQAFEAVGGFDERYFLYGEDQDLCHRLRRAGWELVALPDRWAVHTSGGSSPDRFGREWVWWRGTLQFAAAWWDSRAWALALVAAVLQWVRFAAARPREARRSWDGIIRFALRERRERLASVR